MNLTVHISEDLNVVFTVEDKKQTPGILNYNYINVKCICQLSVIKCLSQWIVIVLDTIFCASSSVLNNEYSTQKGRHGIVWRCQK
jgi:chorismate mutase